MNGSVQDIGRQLLVYGRRLPLAEVFARIDAVSAETVQRVATEVLSSLQPCDDMLHTHSITVYSHLRWGMSSHPIEGWYRVV